MLHAVYYIRTVETSNDTPSHKYTKYMENIRDLIAIFGRKALASPGRIHEVIEEHQEIIQALKHKNKQKGAESIKYHLATTEKSLVENQ